MMKASLTLLLIAGSGCSSLAGIVLDFPSASDEAKAAHAEIQVITPPTPTSDNCMSYLSGALTPTPVVFDKVVDLANGSAKQTIPTVPNGYETVLVSITDASTQPQLILHGCTTKTITAGQSIEIHLKSTVAPPPDLSPVPDMTAIDMQAPPDMAMPNLLSVTTTEMRTSGRDVGNVAITVTDKNGTNVTGTTAATNGNVMLDVTALTPPFTIVANAPVSNGYQGAVTLTGLMPTFSSNTVAITMPIDLDPPATTPGNVITVNPTDGASKLFDMYWISGNGAAGFNSGELQSNLGTSATAVTGNLVMSTAYRIGVVYEGAAKNTPIVFTPGPVIGAGTFSPSPTVGPPGNFQPYDKAFTLNYVFSSTAGAAAYSTQSYGVNLVLPASQTQLALPIIKNKTFTASGPDSTANVPSMPGMIQIAAQVQTEMIAIGASARAELRHQLATPVTASDTFVSGVPDPPAATLTPPSPTTHAASFSISATPPSGFPLANAFVHVNIHDSAQKYHWHLIAQAATAGATTIPVAGGVLPDGMYSVDVAFVNDFSFIDGSFQATLTADYSHLIRPIAAELSQVSIPLTVMN